MKGHKRRTEAGRKCHGRLRDARFGSRHLSSIAGDKVECGLTRSEPGNRGQHTVCITGEKENVPGISSERRLCNLPDMFDRVTYPGVFCFREIGIVDFEGSL